MNWWISQPWSWLPRLWFWFIQLVQNLIYIKQVLHLSPAAPSQMNKQLGLIESPAYFQTIRPRYNRTNASMNQFTCYQNTTNQLHGYRPKCSWEHGNLQWTYTDSTSLRDEYPIPKNALLCGRATGRHTRPLWWNYQQESIPQAPYNLFIPNRFVFVSTQPKLLLSFHKKKSLQ